MKKLRIKYLLTVICMLAAGICYSCGKGTNQVDLDGQTLVMDLQAEQTSQEAGVQSGLISAKTEAGEDSPDEPETGSGEEPLPWQTESVRFYVHICGEVVKPGVYEMEPYLPGRGGCRGLYRPGGGRLPEHGPGDGRRDEDHGAVQGGDRRSEGFGAWGRR